jgi:hypothetical protein
MTATATIDVKYVNPPKNGNAKAPWSVKDAHGQYWKYWPDRSGRIDAGTTIQVEWKEGDEYQGKRDQIITKVIGLDANPPPPRASTNGNAAPAAAPRPAQDDRTPERIFVCGIINASIQAGALQPFNAGDIAAVGQAAQQAYAQLFGK